MGGLFFIWRTVEYPYNVCIRSARRRRAIDFTELTNWNEYTKLLIGLLVIANPLKNIPVFLGLTDGFSAAEKRKTLLISVITFIIALVIFTYAGLFLLELFGITIPAFRIAGGIMFLFYGLNLMGLVSKPAAAQETSEATSVSVGIVPMGIPMFAGPGAITTIILFASIHPSPEHKLLLNGVILSVALLLYLIFTIAIKAGPFLGKTFENVMYRVMGLVMTAIGVEFILDGIIGHFPDLTGIH